MQEVPFSRKAAPLEWALFALVVGLAWVLVAQPGPIPVMGHLQDVFLPLNAVAVLEEGIRLHSEIHSPFGFIYFWLHWLAWKAHQMLALEGSVIGVIALAGLIFSLLPILVLILLRYVLGRNNLTRPWLAAFVVALAVSPRNQGEYDHKELLWYGMYNNQLWSLSIVFLAALAVLLTSPEVREMLRRHTLRQSALVVALALGLYVAFHFKASFFLTISAITAAILIVLGPAVGARVVYGIGGLMLMAVVLTALAGYDYPGYFENLSHAVRAKQETAPAHGAIAGVALASALASAFLFAARVGVEGTRTPEEVALAFAPAGLATAGVALGVLGDYSAAASWLWLLPAFALFASPGLARPIRLVAVAFFAAHILLDTLSLARAVQLRSTGADKEGYEAVQLGEPSQNFQILVEVEENLQVSSLMKLENGIEAWIGAASFAPTLGLEQLPEVWNLPYAQGRGEASEWLRTSAKGLAAGEVEFVHGATWLAGTPPPTGPHWFHLGTTMASSELVGLWDWYKAWDVILVPVLSPGGRHQMVLACNFFRFNRRNGYPFEIVDVTPHWLYFVSRERSETLRNPVLKPWREYDQRIAQGNCRARAQSIW